MRYENSSSPFCWGGSMKLPEIDVAATGQRICQLCAERCISAEEIRDALRLSSIYVVIKWQLGQSVPDIHHLVRLAAYLNVPIDDIICCREVVA